MANYLDLTGLQKYDELIKNYINNPEVSVDVTQDATQATVKVAVNDKDSSDVIISAVSNTTAGLMSAADKNKLDSIEGGGEVNQNAFSNIKVGNTTISADSKTDTFELVAGTNITLTPNSDKITISSSDTAHTHSVGVGLTKTGNGGVDGDVKYELKTSSADEIGGVKIGYTENGSNYPVELDTNSKAFVNVPWTDTTKFSISAGTNAASPTTDEVEVVANQAVSASGAHGQTANSSFTAVKVATKAYVDKAVTGLFEYKGTIGTGGTVTSLPAKHDVGDVYYVKTDGTYAGESCQVGDMIICVTAGTTANNAHWEVINGNWTATDGTAKIPFGGSQTLATIGGVSIDAQIGTVNGDGTYIDVAADGDNLKVSHKDPVAVAGSKISKDASSTTTATWGTSIVTGVDIERDAKGHVTNMTLDSIKLPENPHIQGANIVTNSATNSSRAEAANGNVHINHIENGAVTSAVKLAGSNGTEVTTNGTQVNISLTDDAYKFTDGTNSFTVTKPSGDTQTVNVTPSIANNVTYSSAVDGKIAVFDGTTGKIKSTGHTIATSVPSNAVFTDTKCTTATINADSTTPAVQGHVRVVSNANVSLSGSGTSLSGNFTAVDIELHSAIPTTSIEALFATPTNV